MGELAELEEKKGQLVVLYDLCLITKRDLLDTLIGYRKNIVELEKQKLIVSDSEMLEKLKTEEKTLDSFINIANQGLHDVNEEIRQIANCIAQVIERITDLSRLEVEEKKDEPQQSIRP